MRKEIWLTEFKVIKKYVLMYKVVGGKQKKKTVAMYASR